MAALVGVLGTLARPLAGLAALRRLQIDAGPAGLRQTDRNRLLRRAGSVFAFANVMHLLADELAGLSGRRLALTPISLGSFHGFLLGHDLAPYSNPAIMGRNCRCPEEQWDASAVPVAARPA